jgi:hypothetical protein
MPPTYKKAQTLKQICLSIAQVQLSNTNYEIIDVPVQHITPPPPQKPKLKLKCDSKSNTDTGPDSTGVVEDSKTIKKNNDIVKVISAILVKHGNNIYALTNTQQIIHGVKNVNVARLKFVAQFKSKQDIITLDFPYNELVEENMTIKQAYSFINLTHLLNKFLADYQDIDIYHIDLDNPVIEDSTYSNINQLITIHYLNMIDNTNINPVVKNSQLLDSNSNIFDIYTKSGRDSYLYGSPVFVIGKGTLTFKGLIYEIKENYLTYFPQQKIFFDS